MKTVKVGMIGAGQIAYGHCRSLQKHPQAELVAVADPSTQRARALKKEFGLQDTYDAADDLLAEADVDAVTIAVPNAFHAPLSLAALKAEKHVLLDKPFALNAQEAKKVVQAAKRARRVFMLGMNWRYRPETQTLRTLVGRGELGEIYHAKTSIRRRAAIPTFGTWFGRKKLAGGGALLDLGVHFLDLCLYAMDNFQPVAVSGAAYRKFGHRGLGEGSWGMSDRGKHVFDVDDFATGFIKCKNGATVQLDASWVLHQAENVKSSVELFGTEGGASLMPLQIYRFGKKKGEYEVTEPQNVKLTYPDADRHMNWINAILKKEKPACTPAQALTVQKVLDAIYKSSETGKEVRIR